MILQIILLIFVALAGCGIGHLLWMELEEDHYSSVDYDRKSIKKSISKWYKGTRLFMWSNNRKNGVTILSEKEYRRLLEEGKIKYVVIEEES